jgi:hypothetical protein
VAAAPDLAFVKYRLVLIRAAIELVTLEPCNSVMSFAWYFGHADAANNSILYFNLLRAI